MEHLDQSQSDEVILQGQLTDELGMPKVLELVAEHIDVVHGVLRVQQDDKVAFIAINNGKEITGAFIRPQEEFGAGALKAAFLLDRGEYLFCRLDRPPGNLDQSLRLSIDRLFSRMNKALEGSLDQPLEKKSEASAPIEPPEQTVKAGVQPAEKSGKKPKHNPPNDKDVGHAGDKDDITPGYMRKMYVAAGAVALLALGYQLWTAYSAHTHFVAGVEALKMGMPDVAANEFQDAARFDARLPGLYLYSAIAQARKGDAVAAIADYSAVLESDPKNTQALLGRASQYVKTKDFSKAVSDCDAALKTNQSLSDAYRIKAVAEIKSGDYDQAVSDIRRYLGEQDEKGKHTDLADAYAILGMAALKADEFGTAIDFYTKAIQLDAKSSNLFAGRAAAFKEAGDWKNALADCNEAIKLGASWESFRLRAMCKQATSDLEGAIADLKTAMNDNPKDLALLRQRAEVEAEAGKWADAAEDYHYLLSWQPGDSESLSRYEFVRQQLKNAQVDTAQSATDPEAEGSVYTGDAASLTKKGYDLIKQGDPAEAVMALSAAVKAAPSDPQARLYLAHALLMTQDFKSAAHEFGVAAALKPLSDTDRVSYAHALEVSGQTPLALSMYEKLLTQDGTNKQVRLSLIDLYARNNQLEKAERAAQDGIARSTSDADKKIFQLKLKQITDKPKQTILSPDEA